MDYERELECQCKKELERLYKINGLLKRKIQATIDFYTSTYSDDLEEATEELQAVSDELYRLEEERA